MSKITWSKVASELRKKYIEEKGNSIKCKLCGWETRKESNVFKILKEIYDHFSTVHPDELQATKDQLRSGKEIVTKITKLTEFM